MAQKKLRDVRAYGTETAFRRGYVLEGVAILIEGHWLDRIGRWQLYLRSPSGTVLAYGQAAPGGELVTDPRASDQPPGRFIWGAGPEPYTRTDLGETFHLYYIESADLAEPRPSLPVLLARIGVTA